MSLDRTGLANNALSRVGAKVIQDIDDDTNPDARLVKVVFDTAFRYVARQHNWNCLVKREILGEDTGNVPPFKWARAFRMPSDWIKTIEINGLGVTNTQGRYAVEGRHIVTNDEECNLVYVSYVTDFTILDEAFTSALIVYLASLLATRKRQDEGLSQQLLEEFRREHLQNARKTDGNERNKPQNDITRDSNWIRSRYFSTNG